ncbi:MAG: heme exporter protein CcmB [Deltaproteobacteria bacterium]|nr:heme exporter protein CcmB [Deltaproteobacteria bacterium]
MTTLRLGWALLRKDLAIAVRTREVAGLLMLFALLCAVVFAFGFLRQGRAAHEQLPGVLWVTLLFTNTLGLLRLFAPDEEAGALPQVVRSIAGPAPLFWSKAALQLCFSALICAFLAPVVALFLDARVAQPQWVALALALGLVGQALCGALCAGLLTQVRLREVLLPLVLYPLTAPLLLGGVQVAALAMDGAQLAEMQGWLMLMVGFDLLAVVLCPWLFGRASA